jgi:flagellar basal-body rod modification protein FlgD
MIDPISSTPTSATLTAGRVPIQTLGQEDFIKILVTQLTTQDPMNPQKDTEFIGQMAQFSQLESSKDMRTELENLRLQQDFLKANSMIGRKVQFDPEEGLGFVGTVTGMQVVDGQPQLAVGDKLFTLSDVVRIEQATATGGTYAR